MSILKQLEEAGLSRQDARFYLKTFGKEIARKEVALHRESRLFNLIEFTVRSAKARPELVEDIAHILRER